MFSVQYLKTNVNVTQTSLDSFILLLVRDTSHITEDRPSSYFCALKFKCTIYTYLLRRVEKVNSVKIN